MAATTTDEIIQQAIQLRFDQWTTALAALQESMQPSLPDNDIEQAWSDEIQCRIAKIEKGEVQTVSSDEAWKLIDDSAS